VGGPDLTTACPVSRDRARGLVRLGTVDREAVYGELRDARVAFRGWVEDASRADLARRSEETRWTNRHYLGSVAWSVVFPRRRLAGSMDRVTQALERRLRAETDARLRRGMSYPPRWDPFFKDFMTLADLYHYPTQHFGFHARQLTLPHPPGTPSGQPR
jgi:hypothetical protein